MSILQTPDLVDRYSGQSMPLDAHEMICEPRWATKLAACVGGEAAYAMLRTVPEQILHEIDHLVAAAMAGKLSFMRSHALQLKGLASRYGALPLAFAALEVANHHGCPDDMTLLTLRGLGRRVAEQIRTQAQALKGAAA